MLCINCYNAIHWLCNSINTEWLCLHALIWLCSYDSLQRNFIVMNSCNWISHFKLKRTITLFFYFAGDCISQYSNAIITERRFCAFVQNWIHIVYHLGVISTDCMPELIVISFSPLIILGNSSADILLFRFVCPTYAF